MTATREPLEYVRRFQDKTFVVSPEPAIAEEAIKTNLHDLLLISDIGTRTVLVLPNGQEPIINLPIIGYTDMALYPGVAAKAAVEAKAAKLIFLCTADGIHDSSDRLINHLNVEGAQALLAEENAATTKTVTRLMRSQLEAAIWACLNGIDRVHFVCGTKPGLMLAELFTSTGTGTMITCHMEMYEHVTRATHADHDQIAAFLTSSGIQFDSRAIIPDNFVVLREDNEILGTICVTLFDHTLVLTCIAVGNHLHFDEIFSHLLDKAILLAEERFAREVSVGLKYNQNWLLVSPVLKQAGFSFLEDDGSWHLTLH